MKRRPLNLTDLLGSWSRSPARATEGKINLFLTWKSCKEALECLHSNLPRPAVQGDGWIKNKRQIGCCIARCLRKVSVGGENGYYFWLIQHQFIGNALKETGPGRLFACVSQVQQHQFKKKKKVPPPLLSPTTHLVLYHEPSLPPSLLRCLPRYIPLHTQKKCCQHFLESRLHSLLTLV